MKKGYIKQLIKDPKHWIGWLITTVSLTVVLYIFNIITQGQVLKTGILTIVVVVIVDLIKHKVKLQ